MRLYFSRNLILPQLLLAFGLGIVAVPAIALEPAAIQTKAAKFIVKIGGDRGGTGFFVHKSNNRYRGLSSIGTKNRVKDFELLESCS